MPERLVFDITAYPNPRVIAQAFFATSERAQQLEEPVKQTTGLISDEIKTNFEVEGRPRWESLAAATVAKKQRKGTGDKKILQDSEDLYNDATGEWEIGGSGQLVSAELRTPGYGRFHLGEGAPANNMPPRDWAYYPPEMEDEIDDIFSEWVTAPLETL